MVNLAASLTHTHTHNVFSSVMRPFHVHRTGKHHVQTKPVPRTPRSKTGRSETYHTNHISGITETKTKSRLGVFPLSGLKEEIVFTGLQREQLSPQSLLLTTGRKSPGLPRHYPATNPRHSRQHLTEPTPFTTPHPLSTISMSLPG